jgi:hypothetical protein
MTPAQAAGDLRRSAAGLDKAVVPSLERGARDARAEAIRTLRSGGLGGRIFRDRDPAIDVSVSTDGAAVEIAGFGMAAKIETGTRTDAHRIEPKSGRRILALKVGGRVGFVTGGVDHKGGRVQKKTAIEESLERQTDRMARGVEDAAARQIGAD